MKVTDTSKQYQICDRSPSDRPFTSKFTLKFSNNKYENDYKEAVLSEFANTLGINHREKCKSYMLTYYVVILLYNAAYLSTYLEDYSAVKIIVFQTVILTSLTAVSSLFLFNFLIKDYQSKYKSTILIITYIVTSITISFNCSFVPSKISSVNTHYGFTTILGILPLFFSSKFTIFYSFLKYLITNISIAVIYLIITLIVNTNTQSTVIEFLFMLSVIIIESHDFYLQETVFREKFITVKKILEDQKPENLALKTDIEEITKNIKESMNLIQNLSTAKDKRALYTEKIFDNLSKVMGLLGKRSSVYSLDLEDLDKNLDDNDKIFIEETCIQPALKKIAKETSRLTFRKAADVARDYKIQELLGILKRVGKEWNFDMFFLRDCTQNKPLYTIASFSIQRFHLDTAFSIESEVYNKYFTEMENLYLPNPYHNSTHAADVLSSFLFMVNQSGLKDFVQDYEIFAGIVAMLGHDVAHPGVTNRYLINTKDSLSITYNDYSVLEMMHCATTFKLMLTEDQNIFKNLSSEIKQVVRSLVIDMILATDMAKHFDLIGKFKAKLNCAGVNLSLPDHRNEVLKIITKACDVGHAAKTQAFHQKWTELVCEEFFNQGDKEKKLGLPVSMFCDREKTDLSKSQIGFIRNIVLPIYESINLCLVSQAIRVSCVEQLEENIKMWESSQFKKRVMTLSVESNDLQNIRVRTETMTGKIRSSFGG